MSQYQKDRRNATSCLFSLADVSYLHWQLLIGLLLLALLAAWPSRPAAAAPAQQEQPPAAAELVLPVLTPIAANGISLHTHTVDLAFTPGDGLALPLTMRAVYRLHNEGKEPATITLRVPSVAGATLTLSVDDTPLAPVAQADGAPSVAVTVQPDQPVTLVLDYAGVIADRRLPQVRYPAADLDQWLGSVSMRMDIRPPASMPPNSWLRAEPRDWAYAPPGVAPDPALEWLYDGDPPEAISVSSHSPGRVSADPGGRTGRCARRDRTGLRSAGRIVRRTGAGGRRRRQRGCRRTLLRPGRCRVQRWFAPGRSRSCAGTRAREPAWGPGRPVPQPRGRRRRDVKPRVRRADDGRSFSRPPKPACRRRPPRRAGTLAGRRAAPAPDRCPPPRRRECRPRPDRPAVRCGRRRRGGRLPGGRAPGARGAAGVGTVGTGRPPGGACVGRRRYRRSCAPGACRPAHVVRLVGGDGRNV